MIKTHFFWAYGELSRLEQLSLISFLKQGYEVNLWTYGDMPNAPKGVFVQDAREILPENTVFLNQRGSYASFSDLFSYAVLVKIGGLYADTDVIALKSAAELPSTPFIVSERSNQKKNLKTAIGMLLNITDNLFLNVNVIYNPNPQEGNLIDLAYAYSLRFPKQNIKWSEIGPKLLNAITKIYPAHGFEIMSPSFANPINYSDCPKDLLTPGINLPKSAFFLHCYNDRWRKSGIDKNIDYPKDSLMYRLEKFYLNLTL
jgi:hypothetical protein